MFDSKKLPIKKINYECNPHVANVNLLPYQEKHSSAENEQPKNSPPSEKESDINVLLEYIEEQENELYFERIRSSEHTEKIDMLRRILKERDVEIQNLAQSKFPYSAFESSLQRQEQSSLSHRRSTELLSRTEEIVDELEEKLESTDKK